MNRRGLSIGIVALTLIGMILAAVVTRKCGNVYSDQYRTADEQEDAVARNDTIKSGLYKDGSVALADTTRPIAVGVCAPRFPHANLVILLVGAAIIGVGLWFANRPAEAIVVDHVPNPNPPPTPPGAGQWRCWKCKALNNTIYSTCQECGAPRKPTPTPDIPV